MLQALSLFIALTSVAFSPATVKFDSNWVSAQPEVLTYRPVGEHAGEIYQLAIVKNQSTIETRIIITSPGFMKYVTGAMTLDMAPVRSGGSILIGGQAEIDTDARYDGGKVQVTTVMQPGSRTIKGEVPYKDVLVDFAQAPFLLRMLPLHADAAFEFTSLNPRNNTLTPWHAKVTGEAKVLDLDSYKVECDDFEGHTVYWIEKSGNHRIVRIEQGGQQHGTLELIK